MGLLDGGIASSFAGIFGQFYLDGLLHVPTRTDELNGDVTITLTGDDGQPAATAIKGQVDQVSESMRQRAGYTDKDQRIIVLAHGVPTITTDHEITLGGVRWMIAAADQDSAKSHWTLRGTRKA